MYQLPSDLRYFSTSYAVPSTACETTLFSPLEPV